ncbi:MAG TPA: hypothetical protein VJN44_05990 [Roseateles sp.]|nr:hypothetical protein [Roseateles sp.]
MNSTLRAALLPLLATLAGCTGVDLGGLGIQKAAPGTPGGFGFTPGAAASAPAAPSQSRSMIGSELDGLLKKHPITSSQKPETWPRVAITLVQASPGVFKTVSFGGPASLAATDCATYKVQVWTDARTGKGYDNLRLCYGELYQRLQRVPLYQVPTWGRRSFWPDERNTGSVRSTGPVPPADHFPSDPMLQQLWLDQYKNTMAFVAGPLAVLGFNWNDVTDKRVWFVSVPAQ